MIAVVVEVGKKVRSSAMTSKKDSNRQHVWPDVRGVAQVQNIMHSRSVAICCKVLSVTSVSCCDVLGKLVHVSYCEHCCDVLGNLVQVSGCGSCYDTRKLTILLYCVVLER